MTYDLEVGELFDEFNSFLNYCHYEYHSEDTLRFMADSLVKFKTEVEKHFFPFAETEFTTPKYHILEHYVEQVRQFGSLLNGDTDTTEGYHPIVKRAYKNTNKKGTFALLSLYFTTNNLLKGK